MKRLNKQRNVNSTSTVSMMASVLLIIISPTELILKTEQIYYIICIIPLALSFLFSGAFIKRDYSLSILLFVCYMLLSLFWTPYVSASRKALVQTVTLLFLFLQLQFTYSQDSIDTFKKAIIFQYCFLLVIFFVFGKRDWDGRVWIVFADNSTDPNSICSWIIIPFVYLLERTIEERGKYRWFFACLVISILYVLFQVGSRSGIIVALVCGLFVSVSVFRERIRKNAIKAVIIILIGALGIYIAFLSLPTSVLARFGHESTQNLGGRTKIWGLMFSLIIAHPYAFLFGFGEAATIAYTSVVAHNLYIELLFNEGLVGLSLVLFFMIKAIRNSWRENKYTAIGLIGIAIMSATLSEFASRPVMIAFFLCGLKKRNDYLY